MPALNGGRGDSESEHCGIPASLPHQSGFVVGQVDDSCRFQMTGSAVNSEFDLALQLVANFFGVSQWVRLAGKDQGCPNQWLTKLLE